MKDIIGETLRHKGVVLELSCNDAKAFQHALSDILCWSRGFIAACPESGERHPIGVDELRLLNIKIKNAINEFEART